MLSLLKWVLPTRKGLARSSPCFFSWRLSHPPPSTRGWRTVLEIEKIGNRQRKTTIQQKYNIIFYSKLCVSYYINNLQLNKTFWSSKVFTTPLPDHQHGRVWTTNHYASPGKYSPRGINYHCDSSGGAESSRGTTFIEGFSWTSSDREGDPRHREGEAQDQAPGEPDEGPRPQRERER